MDEKDNVGFEDFESALFDGDYQFDGEDGDFDAVETDDTEDGDVLDDSAEDAEPDDEEADPADEEESDEDDTEDEDEGDEEDPADNTDAGQTFTLKVNKEERQVTLEEMTALAQKGADYDRVKEQNTKSQQTIQDLQAQLEGFSGRKDVLDILDIVADKTGTKLEDLAEMLYLNVRKSAGASEDLAREELKRAKVEKELDGFKTQKTHSEQQEDSAETRAQREIEAFKKDYPDVQLTDELVAKLTPDLQKGTSLSAAYRNLEKAQADARIRELEQQLAAKKQNDKNKKRSPGSQKDSGGRRTKDGFDDFMSAFN